MSPRTKTNPVDLSQIRASIQRARHLDHEVAAFNRRWAAPTQGFTALPVLSWEQLERQITDLALRTEAAETALRALQGWRSIAWAVPSEMLLREILITAWAAMDESFLAKPMSPDEDDGEEFPMP